MLINLRAYLFVKQLIETKFCDCYSIMDSCCYKYNLHCLYMSRDLAEIIERKKTTLKNILLLIINIRTASA